MKNRINKEDLQRLIDFNRKLTRTEISEMLNISESLARIYKGILENHDVLVELILNDTETDEEVIAENVKLAKQRQRLLDSNRIERKSFREYSRAENAVAEYTKELICVFDENPVQIETIEHKCDDCSAVGVFHVSDSHFNEIVEMSSNSYDFSIASKRYRKMVIKAKEYFSTKKIKNVLFAMTGDLMNSDRRLDELLSMATNRSRATFLAIQILENMIFDLNKEFNVHVASVSGNESRIPKDIGWQDVVAMDTYDTTIYNILAYHLKDKSGITFLGGDSLRAVVDVAGHNWLLIHGHQSGFNAAPEKAVTKLVRQYADNGIIIRHVIFGHIHEAMIADLYARSASPVGANAYSEEGLMLTSRASQNIYAAYEDGSIDSMKVDLQNIDGIEGYPIKKELEAYNAKSATKTKSNEIIFKVVI